MSCPVTPRMDGRNTVTRTTLPATTRQVLKMCKGHGQCRIRLNRADMRLEVATVVVRRYRRRALGLREETGALSWTRRQGIHLRTTTALTDIPNLLG